MKKAILVSGLAAVLSGCISEENSLDKIVSGIDIPQGINIPEGNDEPIKAPKSLIPVLVKKSNFQPDDVRLIDSDTLGPYNQTGTVRFDTTSKIPLYYVSANGSAPSQQIIKGFQQLEARLGDIFTDFTPVSADLSIYRDLNFPSENRGNDTFNSANFHATHGITSGLVVAEGTAFFSTQHVSNPQEMCGNASTGPYSGSSAININPTTGLYSSDTVLWLNMGNGQCNWDYQMVMHETAHNMGMFNHIDEYFGLWSDTAMNMLATLYSNPARSAYGNLVVNYQ